MFDLPFCEVQGYKDILNERKMNRALLIAKGITCQLCIVPNTGSVTGASRNAIGLSRMHPLKMLLFLEHRYAQDVPDRFIYMEEGFPAPGRKF